jgi:glycosyltransferase involved in cell wall biosynthesis
MATKQKTVILIRNAQPYDFGGGERFPTFVAEILKSKNFNPVIVSASRSIKGFAASHSISTVDGWWWRNQHWSGFRALLFPVYLLWQLVLLFHYLFIFIRLRPVAIHIQSKDDFIAATFAGKVVGAKIIWTDHADLKHIWKNVRIWFKNPIGKLVYLSAIFTDAIVTVSRNETKLIMRNLSERSLIWQKLELIHNGCSDMYAATPRKPQDIFTFCIASRLVTDKGIGETIEAFSRLHSDFPKTQLLLLGDGPEAKKFKGQARGAAGIHFMGHQDNPYIPMASSDVFLQPTYHDAFSVVLVEASMLGLAIIATKIGGNVEIIFD